jgi:hypothetical protein
MVTMSPNDSSSHRHALFPSIFSFNTTSTSSFDEWIIDSRASYHMAKDKDIFSSLISDQIIHSEICFDIIS